MKPKVAHGWGLRVNITPPELAVRMHRSREQLADVIPRDPVFRPVRVVLVPLADYRALCRKAKAADAVMGARKGGSRG